MLDLPKRRRAARMAELASCSHCDKGCMVSPKRLYTMMPWWSCVRSCARLGRCTIRSTNMDPRSKTERVVESSRRICVCRQSRLWPGTKEKTNAAQVSHVRFLQSPRIPNVKAKQDTPVTLPRHSFVRSVSVETPLGLQRDQNTFTAVLYCDCALTILKPQLATRLG